MKSKTGAKAVAAAAKVTKALVAVPKKQDRSMRKLLAKNARKRNNREARQAKAAAQPTSRKTKSAAYQQAAVDVETAKQLVLHIEEVRRTA